VPLVYLLELGRVMAWVYVELPQLGMVVVWGLKDTLLNTLMKNDRFVRYCSRSGCC